MKQTAVEFLIEEIKPFLSMPIEDAYKTILQAKEMEKQQQKVMFDCGRQYQLTGEGTFTQVHNETYGK
jgi:hypothetical protein